MKEIVSLTIDSVKNKINKNKRELTFEIFGYDFILDSDFHLWLIEINTNPSLEQNGPVTNELIPRMIGKI